LWIGSPELFTLENVSDKPSYFSAGAAPLPASHPTRKLIINADDFGLTEGVNRSIFQLAVQGALTSTTLMAAGPAFDDAVRVAGRSSTLGVGCHVVLVDGQPVAPREQIPTLLDQNREFRPTLGKFVRDLMLGRIREDEIEAEAFAQIQRLQHAGIAVTHVDTHKHTHMFPAVLKPLLRAAARCGVPAVRTPFEPDWALAATSGAPALRRLEVRILRSRRAAFLRLIRLTGFVTTGGAVGVLATGTLNTPTLQQLRHAMPDGVWELVCHPGYNDTALAAVRTRLRESRAVEHSALLEVVPNLASVERMHFGALSS
jgi:chitin disaccharide deacetylase